MPGSRLKFTRAASARFGRIFETLGYFVEKLIRVRVGPISPAFYDPVRSDRFRNLRSRL